MSGEILIPMIIFLFLGSVVIVPIYLAHKGRIARMDLMRQALDKGQTLDPKILEQLYETERPKSRQDQPRRTLGSGVVLTFLAIGLGLAGWMTDGFSPDNGMFVAAVIVGCLGLAFIILAIVDYSAKSKEKPLDQG
jgi:uncharacterized membrane protein YcjF (UPF0283 family)